MGCCGMLCCMALHWLYLGMTPLMSNYTISFPLSLLFLFLSRLSPPPHLPTPPLFFISPPPYPPGTLAMLGSATKEPELLRRYCLEVVHAVAAFPLGKFHPLLRSSGAVALLDRLGKDFKAELAQAGQGKKTVGSIARDVLYLMMVGDRDKKKGKDKDTAPTPTREDAEGVGGKDGDARGLSETADSTPGAGTEIVRMRSMDVSVAAAEASVAAATMEEMELEMSITPWGKPLWKSTWRPGAEGAEGAEGGGGSPGEHKAGGGVGDMGVGGAESKAAAPAGAADLGTHGTSQRAQGESHVDDIGSGVGGGTSAEVGVTEAPSARGDRASRDSRGSGPLESDVGGGREGDVVDPKLAALLREGEDLLRVKDGGRGEGRRKELPPTTENMSPQPSPVEEGAYRPYDELSEGDEGGGRGDDGSLYHTYGTLPSPSATRRGAKKRVGGRRRRARATTSTTTATAGSGVGGEVGGGDGNGNGEGEGGGGGGRGVDSGPKWICEACTFVNDAGGDRCIVCRAPKAAPQAFLTCNTDGCTFKARNYDLLTLHVRRTHYPELSVTEAKTSSAGPRERLSHRTPAPAPKDPSSSQPKTEEEAAVELQASKKKRKARRRRPLREDHAFTAGTQPWLLDPTFGRLDIDLALGRSTATTADPRRARSFGAPGSTASSVLLTPDLTGRTHSASKMRRALLSGVSSTGELDASMSGVFARGVEGGGGGGATTEAMLLADPDPVAEALNSAYVHSVTVMGHKVEIAGARNPLGASRRRRSQDNEYATTKTQPKGSLAASASSPALLTPGARRGGRGGRGGAAASSLASPSMSVEALSRMTTQGGQKKNKKGSSRRLGKSGRAGGGGASSRLTGGGDTGNKLDPARGTRSRFERRPKVASPHGDPGRDAARDELMETTGIELADARRHIKLMEKSGVRLRS